MMGRKAMGVKAWRESSGKQRRSLEKAAAAVKAQKAVLEDLREKELALAEALSAERRAQWGAVWERVLPEAAAALAKRSDGTAGGDDAEVEIIDLVTGLAASVRGGRTLAEAVVGSVVQGSVAVGEQGLVAGEVSVEDGSASQRADPSDGAGGSESSGTVARGSGLAGVELKRAGDLPVHD